MFLENNNCNIDIKIDETFTIDSADNRYYNIIHNPCHYKHNDFAKTLAIHIDLFSSEYSIALVGPFYTYDSDCAINRAKKRRNFGISWLMCITQTRQVVTLP